MQEGQEPTRFNMPAGLPELMAALEQSWPAMQAALRASGAPLNDDDPDPDPDPDAKPDPDPKPPWGDDFDAERAWKLITNLRSDVDKAKKRGDELAVKVKEHDDASKTEQEKAAERAQQAEQTAAAAQREAARLRIALKKGLTETQAKRLVGDTEEELEADADELLASFKQGKSDDGDPTRRSTPKPRLRTGAAADADPEEIDPAKLAAQVPRPYQR